MEINTLKKNKESLELQINELINRFELANNVEISSLYLTRKTEWQINDGWAATTATLNKDDQRKEPEVKITISL